MKTQSLSKSIFIAAAIAVLLQTVSCDEDAKKAAIATAEAEAAKKAAEEKEAELKEFIASGGGFFTDSRDGKTYRTAKIGEQTWMAENLNYEAEDGESYDWETAKKACPADWHLPSEEEWQTLVNFLGGNRIVGEKLKWEGKWWTASERDDGYAYYRHSGSFYWEPTYKTALFNVRCLQDQDKKQLREAMAKLEPMAELEQEAEKWIKNGRPFERRGKYFSFRSIDKSQCTECGHYSVEWTATSNTSIDDCPANSIWKMGRWAEEMTGGKGNIVPPDCESITPKAITDYSEEYDNTDYSGEYD